MQKLILVIVTVLLLTVTNSYSGVDLDGGADCINTPVTINTNNNWSAAGWAVVDDLTTGNQHFFGVHNSNRFYIGVTADNYFFACADTFDNTTAASALSDGVWFHWGLVMDNGTCRYYVNGTQVDSFAYTGIGNNTLAVRIGARQGGSNSCEGFLGGDLSDITIWDTVITSAEMSRLADSKVKRKSIEISPADRQGHWPLDDFGDGTNLNTTSNGYKDISGNGNHGTGVDADNSSNNIAESVLSYP